MKFDRYRVQSRVESYIGCDVPKCLKEYKKDFVNIQLTSSHVYQLIEDLKYDSKDVFFKGIYSLCEAFNNIDKGNYSWSVVKIYYASFYLIRCILATENYAIIKCNGVFMLKLAINEKPIALDGRGGEHPQIITKYKKIMGSKDPLLSNTINGDGETYLYDYLKELREIINYREPFFREPQNDFFESFSNSNTVKEKIVQYFNDKTMDFCFQTPYCLLSAPIFLLCYTNKILSEFVNKKIILEKERCDVIRELVLPLGLEELFKENNLIS